MSGIGPVDFNASINSIGSASAAHAEASLKVTGKAKEAAMNFESMFLSNMFQQMFTNIDGDGPFGGSGALKIWRSFMTDQYAKSFAKAGGIGLAPHIYEALLKRQGLSAS